MQHAALALTVAGLAFASAGVAAAHPGQHPGNGAKKAGLAPVSATAPLRSCSAAEGAGTQTATGFVVLSAPGSPGRPDKVVGEVAVRDAEPGTYRLRLAGPGSDACGDVVGQLTVHRSRRGHASFAWPSRGAGTYYVTLTQQPLAGAPVLEDRVIQELYASAPVGLR